MNPQSYKQPASIKTSLHPRNKHRERYDFKLLIKGFPALEPYVKLNSYNDESIDFFNPSAVKALNKALLKVYYGIDYWDIPENYLCPPIPGRADYIHYMADVLGESNNGIIPKGKKIKCLDIGVGANCVYPIIGNREYGWQFVGSDIDKVSVASATKIVEMNSALNGQIEIRLQTNAKDIFKGIIQKDEQFDMVICNPPFHASAAEAQASSLRKLRNLKQNKVMKPTLNFGGSSHELWVKGGELNFVRIMIEESKKFKANCLWFSCLISKQSNLENVYKKLKEVSVEEIKTISMGQGNKISRVLVWSFFTPEQQKEWNQKRTE